MRRLNPVLRRARKALQDLDLLKVLESELNHELSSMRFQDEKTGSLGDFVLEWDSPQTQDIVLRKKCSSGEEVAVSALLGSKTVQVDGSLPNEALMKVCVKKPGLKSILLFDCIASNRGGSEPAFDIRNVQYLPLSLSSLGSHYGGPPFSDLDPILQHELKQYLVARGIEENFTNFLLLHLHIKEQNQYTGWLQKLKDMMAEHN